MVDLAGDVDALGPRLAQHLDLSGGLDVDDVEPAPGRLREADQQCGRGVPDDPVVDGERLSVRLGGTVSGGPVGLFDHIHDRLIVGMDHEPETGAGDGPHGLVQVTVVVDADRRRVRIGATGVDHHVDLVGGDATLGHRSNLVEDLGGGVVVVVDDALRCVQVEDGVEVLGGHRGRVEVRHPEDRGVSACGRLPSAGDEVLFVGVARLAGVDVHVHTTGDGDPATPVDGFGVRRAGPAIDEPGDALAVDDDVQRPQPPFDEYVGSGDETGHGCSLRVVTPAAVCDSTERGPRWVANQSTIWGITTSPCWA